MKRNREIILDFTSLLDVIMIILFFLILFSHFEAIDAKSQMEQAQSRADAQTAEAERREREAEAQRSEALKAEKRAQQAYDRLEDAVGRGAENYDAMLEFESGQNLRMLLRMTDDGWILCIGKGDYTGTVRAGGDTAEKLRAALQDAGCEPDMTLLCEFGYDATEAGTKLAHDTVTAALDEIRKTYKQLYISETDESKWRSISYE